MKKRQIINLACFLIFTLSTASLVYVMEKMDMSTTFEKPWHLQPSIHEDSLSQKYIESYKTLNKCKLYWHFGDSSMVQVSFLVDSWGVPNDENKLNEDFSAFKDVPHILAIHHRLANRTKHAERTEFRNNFSPNIYLFGGDSVEYNRPEYIKEIGFAKTIFCQHCSDSIMLEKIDSILVQDSFKFIAWTTQSSRTGDRDSLHHSLKLIADFAKRHSKVRITVQGTHRPILGTPETRRSYKAHWVPVAILNNRK